MAVGVHNSHDAPSHPQSPVGDHTQPSHSQLHPTPQPPQPTPCHIARIAAATLHLCAPLSRGLDVLLSRACHWEGATTSSREATRGTHPPSSPTGGCHVSTPVRMHEPLAAAGRHRQRPPPHAAVVPRTRHGITRHTGHPWDEGCAGPRHSWASPDATRLAIHRPPAHSHTTPAHETVGQATSSRKVREAVCLQTNVNYAAEQSWGVSLI